MSGQQEEKTANLESAHRGLKRQNKHTLETVGPTPPAQQHTNRAVDHLIPGRKEGVAAE